MLFNGKELCMKPINKELVQELYPKYDNWEDRKNAYNEITKENRTTKTLSKNYSRHRERLIKEDENYIEEKPHVSERYIEVETTKLITESELLMLHGYDPTAWEMTSSNSTRSKIGTKGNEEQYFINTYSKITVKPKEWKLTEVALKEMLKINIEPKKLERTVTKGTGLLEIPIFDPHFGISTHEDYERHKQDIANHILSREWETNVYVIGQDTFHNDDFRGRTTSGTEIEKVDMTKAWEDAHAFYLPLIELSLENAKNVHIIYSRGNHDETLGWAFVKGLERLYPQATFETSQEEHKTFKYHNVWLGYTHGDKISDNKIVRYFEALYRLDMAKASRRIIKRGHLHTHKQFDDNGTHVIALGTANKSDQWHIDNGFVGNHKAFEIFVYDENTMRAHIFIE